MGLKDEADEYRRLKDAADARRAAEQAVRDAAEMPARPEWTPELVDALRLAGVAPVGIYEQNTSLAPVKRGQPVPDQYKRIGFGWGIQETYSWENDGIESSSTHDWVLDTDGRFYRGIRVLFKSVSYQLGLPQTLAFPNLKEEFGLMWGREVRRRDLVGRDGEQLRRTAVKVLAAIDGRTIKPTDMFIYV